MRADVSARLRALPKIDAVLTRPDVAAMDVPRWALRRALREMVAWLRARILAGETVPVDEDGKVAIECAHLEERARAHLEPSLCRVINATGVILHTNLGRAPLAERAIERVVDMARGYSNLEYDLDRGGRGSRHAHCSDLLRELTGAEDALVVNNNAGAVMLALAVLAAGREVIVSRGELVEIGGSFRIPDVMRLAGAELVEVGTTNKTRIEDYRAAINERTAVLLKVHPSNFAIVGFTHEASAREIAELGRAHDIVTVMDLGSGSLLPASQCAALGLPAEISVSEAMASGLDLVTFSGDKLLGGPQAGIICGAARRVAELRAHPWVRALRPDKLVLAALEATLSVYRDGRAMAEIPAWSMITEDGASVGERARDALERVNASLAGSSADDRQDDRPGRDPFLEIARCESTVGGGTMPLARIPSYAISLGSAHRSAAALTRSLHALPIPIVGRIVDERVLLDLRTVRAREMDALVAGLVSLVGRCESPMDAGDSEA